MPAYIVGVLKGDGIGPETTAQAVKVLRATEDISDLKFDIRYLQGGGDYFREKGKPLPDETLDECVKCHLLYKGPAGASSVNTTVPEGTMERGLILPVRQKLGLYVNLRDAKPVYLPVTARVSGLKRSTVKGVDIVFVRENSEGLYALLNEDERRALEELRKKTGAVYGLLKYTPEGVERAVRFAFELARKEGRGKVTSLDKANVIEASVFWKSKFREIAKDYPDINADSMYIDAACYRSVMDPLVAFGNGVIVTENTFGDIITDVAGGAIAGSLGMCGSINANPERLYMLEPQQRELYLANPSGAVMAEPVHGTYPQKAGQDVANPIGAIISVEKALKAAGCEREAEIIAESIVKALKQGWMTEDITPKGVKPCSTEQMGSAIADNVRRSRN